MDIEKKAIGTGSALRNVEEDQVSLPVSRNPGSPDGHEAYPPSSLLLLAPVSSHEEQVEAVENSPHITIPEPVTCRICDPDEDEQNDDLVELGCSCKNEMSRMHRKCILEWFGMRMLLQNDHNCEICKTSLHMDTIAVVTEAVSDHENGGRAILLAALKSQLAPLVWMPDVESAADHDELVELLTAARADFLMRLQGGTVNGEIVNNREASRWHQCSWPLVAIFGLVAALVGGYTAIMLHFFGEGVVDRIEVLSFQLEYHVVLAMSLMSLSCSLLVHILS